MSYGTMNKSVDNIYKLLFKYVFVLFSPHQKSLESHNTIVLTALKSLFKFCQGAAHVWDVHELGLARQERALQEKLDGCRQQHDNTNQVSGHGTSAPNPSGQSTHNLI